MCARIFRAWKHLIISVALAGLTCGTVSAQSLGTTFSDLWWNPSESGWGVTLTISRTLCF
jgi:hypothetical protein